MHLRNASMSVALPVISCLHLGQIHGLKFVLVIIRAFHQFQRSIQTKPRFSYVFKQSESSSIYTLASFTDEMPVSTLEDFSWWSHLFQAHLYSPLRKTLTSGYSLPQNLPLTQTRQQPKQSKMTRGTPEVSSDKSLTLGKPS